MLLLAFKGLGRNLGSGKNYGKEVVVEGIYSPLSWLEKERESQGVCLHDSLSTKAALPLALGLDKIQGMIGKNPQDHAD